MKSTTPHPLLSESFIQRMVEFLILNSSFTSDLGLFHGKIGIVIFFAHYARWTGDSIYDDFADELLAEIYEDIHADTPINLESGLCGIGWGIEYLVQNGFMEGNTDEILTDIDRRIMERDPRRITDHSFRTGLGGILFYATARLTASREQDSHPFDTLYLNDLKEAAQQVRFSEQDEIPSQLIETFLLALNGESLSPPPLPQILFENPPSDIENYQTYPLGLEKGIAGILINFLLNNDRIYLNIQTRRNDEEQIFIALESSRAQNYGIGTYISELLDVLSCTGKCIYLLHLSSEKTNSVLYENEGKISHFYIGNVVDRWKGDWKILSYKYYRAVLTVLCPYINKQAIFHLHYLFMADFASILKYYRPTVKIILTVHYTDWSMNLLGDMAEFNRIMSSDEGHEVKTRITEDKRLLDICDHVVSIAKHSFETIMNIYKVQQSKLIYIPHGLRDRYIEFSNYDRVQLRKRLGFEEDDFLVVFAGRIDRIKGVEVLSDAFVGIADKYPQAHLIYIGEGEFAYLHTRSAPYWSKLVTTGFLDKTRLYDLFQISDLGIVPSLYEEFGLVAIEMMMMRLPIIVSRTSGLAEIVINNQTGLTIPLKVINQDEYVRSVKLLQDAIERLINDRKKLEYFAKHGRKHYLQYFDQQHFKERTLRLYHQLFESQYDVKKGIK